MTALQVFGISEEELYSRDLLKKPASPNSRNLRQMTEKMLESILSSRRMFSNERMQMDRDESMMRVQGQQHFYRVYWATGRIERVTDNAELELNWEAVPDHMRLWLHREGDSDMQLYHRAMMLMNDTLWAPYFRVKRNEN